MVLDDHNIHSSRAKSRFKSIPFDSSSKTFNENGNSPEYQKEEDKYREFRKPILNLEKASSTDLIIKIDIKNSNKVRQKLTNQEISTSQDNFQMPEINKGRWTTKEQALFLEGIYLFGLDWRKLEDYVQTRTPIQLKSHGQKVFDKIKSRNNTEYPVEYIQVNPSHFKIECVQEVRKVQQDSFIPESINSSVNNINSEIQDSEKLTNIYREDNEIKDAQNMINTILFSISDEIEMMITINRFLCKIIKQIKEEEGGINLIIVLYVLKLKAVEKLTNEVISDKMKRFLRRLIRVIKQQINQIDKFFRIHYTNSGIENDKATLKNPNIKKIYDSESRKSSFMILNPAKALKFRHLYM